MVYIVASHVPFELNQPRHSRDLLPCHGSPFPPLPVTESTAATLCGQLVLIGGSQGSYLVKNHFHSPASSWTVGGHWLYVL